MFGSRRFRHINWCDTSQGSSTETSDYTSDEDEGSTLRRCLQSTTYKCEDGCEEKTVYSPNAIGCPTTNEAANDGTKIVLGMVNGVSVIRLMYTYNADDTALLCCVCDRARGILTYANFSNVVRGSVDATHNTLVISFEEN